MVAPVPPTYEPTALRAGPKTCGRTGACGSPDLPCNQVQAVLEACIGGLGLGSFLSYMAAPHVRAGRLKYVLEDFEVEPLPVNFLYPQSRMLSPTVRAFADLCAKKLRAIRFD